MHSLYDYMNMCSQNKATVLKVGCPVARQNVDPNSAVGFGRVETAQVVVAMFDT